eukprot:gene13369-4225_t
MTLDDGDDNTTSLLLVVVTRKYKRIFSIGSKAITTYNPVNLEVTNQWPYNEFYGISPSAKSPGEFIINVKKGKEGRKTQSMTFSLDQRAELLTDALRYNAFKHHWSDNRVSTILQVTACSLDQISPSTNKKLCSYDYKDMEGITLLSDYPGGFAIITGGFSRLHLFACEQRDEIIKKVMDTAISFVGISIQKKKEPITFNVFMLQRLGKFSDDESVTSLTEFRVQKVTPRSSDPVTRVFSLSETCIVERDPATYHIVSLQPLSSVFALIRHPETPQLFTVEYVNGTSRQYLCPERDALLASLMDGVRASGNQDIHVKMTPTKRAFLLGQRMAPFYKTVDEEVESTHLKFLQAPPGKFFDAVSRFNSNVAYSGLLHAVTQDTLFAENKEKLIVQGIGALLSNEYDVSSVPAEDLEGFFQALRRLVASKAGFEAFTTLHRFREKVGLKIVKALKREDDGVTHAAIDMLAALMQPMHENYDLKQEQLNKSSLLSSKKFLEDMLDIFSKHVMRGTGALVISALLDFLTFSLCPPYSETTDGTQFDTLLEMVAGLGRCLFRLFQHPSVAIVKGAGMVMKAVIEEGDADIAARMQDLALAEGALPRHLHTAMFTMNTNDSRLLTNRQLSRHLVGLWVTGHPTALALLKRALPAGMLNFLDSTDEVPESELDRMHVRDNLKAAEGSSKNKRPRNLEKFLTHWRERVGEKVGLKPKTDPNKDRPVVLRKRRQRIKSEANWDLFYYQFQRDHSNPLLIWNAKTRDELRDALDAEMRAFDMDKDLSGNRLISWNHQEFEVQYQCLAEEIRIGDYYLRVLLEEDSDEYPIVHATEFFNDLYHRFLLTTKPDMKALCLQAMAKVYSRCFEEIGSFNDTKFIVGMLDRSCDKLERDRLLLFLKELLKNKINVKQYLDAGGMKILVDLVVLSHLHVNKATVPFQTMMIEGSGENQFGNEQEWYYGNGEKERIGPKSFSEMKELWKDGILRPTTRCWAQGMDGWRPLHSVSQLKWCLLATGNPIMNESDLAITCLNMLIDICKCYPNRDTDGAIVRPLPRAKRMLSDASCLPHIVQLLLTFHPTIVEKVAQLLLNISIDNPVLPRLYMTGAFFFIMMYTGSNVIPIGSQNFLDICVEDKKQIQSVLRSRYFFYPPNDTPITTANAHRLIPQENSKEIQQRSILGHILPEAMICYLENYGPEKFAEIFLGEFDTPEAIWSNEMRRMMIEKIAKHISDFSPRLKSNIRALYQYCPIPAIDYPQLENELFCNIYYLRHLCDTTKFPDWPVKEPVKLLKEILEAWKNEVEKKPPDLTIEEAHNVLKLPPGKEHTESSVRKAYYRLAQKYHPDKNPEGRDIFDKVSRAYEYLCSSKKQINGPDPENIVLILKAQSILFKRYKDVLEPYKYAGYPMLIKTITMEAADNSLFSKKTPLLPAASELAFHTINCSALNVEELRRENGIEVLQETFHHCIQSILSDSKMEDVPVQISVNIVKCYSVAALFEECREKITEIPQIVHDLCRILHCKNLTPLCCIVAECISNFSVDFWLQTLFLQSGALWHLLLFLFQYDYTLSESGVEASAESNQQELANSLARLSIRALARMAGFLDAPNNTPDNPAVKKSLTAMLTSYVTKKLVKESPHEILKLLNSNTENPYLIWDNGTRGELTDFLEKQQKMKIERNECDQSFGAEFVFSDHNKELIVGDIFVRVYNEQPTFVLEEPHKFGEALIDYLGSQAQYLHSLMALTSSEIDTSKTSGHRDRLDKIRMALEALRNVIKNSPGVEVRCIGHFKLLFSLLRLTGANKLQQLALEVIAGVTGNSKCVANIADADVLAYLLLTLNTLPPSRLLVLDTLHALISNTKIVKEAMSKGAVIYLLDLFCNSSNPNVRSRAAELFSKMMSDKLIGPRVKIILSKFLPSIFMDAMRDSPEASVHMFEANHENPELIWNDEARERVSATVKRMKDNHYIAQKDDPYVTWKLPDDFSITYDDVEGELVVGGVFLRLFIAQPNWVLRKPKDFMVSIMDKFVNLTSKSGGSDEVLETVTQALVCLFSAQPPLADQVPALGHIPQIFQSMASSNNAIPKSALLVIHCLSDNENNGTDRELEAIIKAMKVRPDCLNIAAEALNRMFEKDNSELVAQAIRVDLVQYLLSLLDVPLRDVKNPAGCKAQIVKTLKSMARDLSHGGEVNAILEGSQIWSSYRDQKHDLFISESSHAGYLTGPVGVAGYLTQGANSPALSANPPPIDHHDD